MISFMSARLTFTTFFRAPVVSRYASTSFMSLLLCRLPACASEGSRTQASIRTSRRRGKGMDVSGRNEESRMTRGPDRQVRI